MNRQPIRNWKSINRVITTAIAVAIGLLITVVLFFNFMPGFGFYIVRTGSMAPAINPGDMIFTTPPGAQVAAGEVITFKLDKNVLVTHRVIDVENEEIQTMGDANEEPDGFTLAISQVEGKYLFRIPFIGLITTILHTRMGWFMIVIVPSILLVLWLVIEIIKEVFKDSKPAPAQVAVANGNTGFLTGPVIRSSPPAGHSKIQTGCKTGVYSRGLPSKEVVKSIRKDLKYLLKDIY